MDMWRDTLNKAAAAAEAARQKVATVDKEYANRLKESALARASELKSAALGSVLPPTSRQEDSSAAGGVSPTPSDAEAGPGNECERLVRSESSESLRTGWSGLKGLASKGLSGLNDKIGVAAQAGKQQCGAAMATASSLKQTGKQQCGAALATASNLKQAGKEQCSAALATASNLSGVSLSKKDPEPETRLGRLCRCCPALTYKQRVIGCFSCLAMGMLLSLTSMMSFTKLLLGNPVPFATKYTLGNLLSLGATAFLIGPGNQCRDMFAPQRRLASLAYFATLGGTLFAAAIKVAVLVLLCILLQFAALTWYTLSYIPFGQATAKRLARKVLKRAGIDLPKGHQSELIAPASSS